MNTSQEEKCYEALVLQRLLNEQLHGEEEASVLSHIETCGTCRDALAGLAGDQEFAPEIAQHFDAEAFDKLAPTTVLGETASVTNLDQLRALLAPSDDPQMIGRLGHYEILGIVGQGSTGVVFKSLDRRLNRYVAIKMLAPAYAGSGPARQRFEREGRSIAAVRDEHVIPVFAVDEHNGLPYIVMEYMPAGSLAQRIENKGSLDTCEVTRIGMQIASALAAAHKQGIIHRDVKPANVLLGSGIDRALVTDFGLARIPDEASVTHSGAISGTPQFMSPEQAKGEAVDFRSDLFSLGSVMYMACTGHSPFRSETVFGVIKRVCETEPRPIRETKPQIEGWLCDFIAKLHSKSPDNRFQSADEVAELLSAELAFLQSPTSVPKPSRTWQVTARTRLANLTLGNWSWSRVGLVAGVALAAVAGVTFALSGMKGRGQAEQKAAPGFALTVGDADDNLWPPPVDLAGSNGDAYDSSRFGYGFETSGATSKSRSRILARENADETIFANSSLRKKTKDDRDDFQLGVDAFNEGDYLIAIGYFKTAAKDGGYGGKAEYNVACAHALRKEADEAFLWLEKAAQAGYFDVGHYRQDADLDNIRSDARFDDLISRLKDRKSLEEQVSKAIRLREKKLYDQANEIYKSVLNQAPNHEKAIVELGLSLHLDGQLDEAVKWHQKAATGESYKHYGYYNIACYYSLKHDADNAFKYLAKSIDVGMDEIRLIERDSDLDFIRNDSRYDKQIEKLAEQLRKNWSKPERECYSLIQAINDEDYKQLTLLLKEVDPNSSCPDYRNNLNMYLAPRQTPLNAATANGNLKAVKMLVGAGANVKSSNGWGKSALMVAADGGHISIAEYLLDRGAKINRKISGMGTALSAAAQAGHINMMKFLIDEGAKIDSEVDGVGTPLMCAARKGQTQAMDLLLSKKANINAQQHGVGTPLSCAARQGEIEAMQLLLDRSAPLDTKVDGVGTALSVAIRAEQNEAVDLLLDAGAEVNAPVHGVGTPLSEAARTGDLAMMKTLLKGDVDLDGHAHGVGTALCVAASEGQIQAIEYLLDAGADPNGTSDGVGTPLSCAVKHNHSQAVRALLLKGADPDRKSPGQKSARDLAEAIGNDEILQILKYSL